MPDGSLLVVEIERSCLSRIAADGGVTPIAFTGGGPNGAAIGPDGKCYVCNNGGLEWREGPRGGLRPIGQAKDYEQGWIDCIDLATGAVKRLFNESDRGRLRGPNDIVFDRHGGFWFTDLGKGRERDLDRGSVCYVDAGLTGVREVIFPMLTPNGIGLSPNEDRLYVAETQTARVWCFEIEAPGQIRRQPWPPSPNGGRLLTGSANYQMFDSLAVDGAGHVCVATIANGGITVVPPDGGATRHVALPDHMTTNICFGGPDLRTAYATLSSTGRIVAFPWDVPGLALNFINRAASGQEKHPC
jgi:gluconolactonase